MRILQKTPRAPKGRKASITSPAPIAADARAKSPRRPVGLRGSVQRYFALEHTVTRILAKSASIMDAAPQVMKAICQCLRWDVGAMWVTQLGQLRCVIVWQGPGIDVPTFEQVTRSSHLPKGEGLPGRIWASGVAAWVPDVSVEGSLPRASTAAKAGLHGAYGFPIGAGVDFRGVLEFYSREILKPDAQLVDMMHAVAQHIGQFLKYRWAEETIRDRDRDFALARQIQQALLPKSAPVLPGFAFAATCRSAQETGGDYYDFFPMPDGVLGIALGDASGHGVAAALVIGQTRACVRALAFTGADARGLLTLTNRFHASSLPPDNFVTLFLAQLDPRARTLLYCSAGHLPAYLFDREGNLRSVLDRNDLPLGIDPTIDYPVLPAVRLHAGDVLFVLSDGVTEAFSTEDIRFGTERAITAVRAHVRETPDEILQALLRAVADFSEGQARIDDLTAVIMKVDDDGPL